MNVPILSTFYFFLTVLNILVGILVLERVLNPFAGIRFLDLKDDLQKPYLLHHPWGDQTGVSLQLALFLVFFPTILLLPCLT